MDDQVNQRTVPPSPTPETPTQALIEPASQIGKPWSRVFAFIVDELLVGTCLGILAFSSFTMLLHLGEWNRVLGFFLALPYFTLLNSRIGNGQTFGKRLMRLRVVDRYGRTISPARAILRYGVLQVPIFFIGASLPSGLNSLPLDLLFAIVTVGAGGCTLYLILFTPRSRQGFHDMAAGTYVISKKSDGLVHAYPCRKYHWVFIGVYLTTIALMAYVPHTEWYSELRSDQAALNALSDVHSSQLSTGINWPDGISGHSLVAKVWAENAHIDPKALANQVARTLLERDHRARRYNWICIVVIRRSGARTEHVQTTSRFYRTPTQWAAILRPGPVSRLSK